MSPASLQSSPAPGVWPFFIVIVFGDSRYIIIVATTAKAQGEKVKHGRKRLKQEIKYYYVDDELYPRQQGKRCAVSLAV